MKKFFAMFLACLCVVSILAAMPMTAAAATMTDEFEGLVGFETYKNNYAARPNGFPAEVIKSEMAEDFGWMYEDKWYGENPELYVEVKKAEFENYVNARYDVSDTTWDAIRGLTAYYWDYKNEKDVTVPFFNADNQTYIITMVGGYGGGIDSVQYEGYVKSGDYYHVYLQVVDYSDTKPTTGTEGKDFEKVELYGDEMYCIYTGQYLKHVVTYKSGILKKFKSTEETALPSGLITKESVTTTTAKKTTTTKKATTTTTSVTTTTAVADDSNSTTTTKPVEKQVVEFVPTEEAPISIVSNAAFPEGTVVDVKPVKTETITVKKEEKAKYSRITAYDITAVRENAAVQPDGVVTATFDIPAEYDPDKTIVLYIADDGSTEVIQSTVDSKNRTITADLSHFSIYALAEQVVDDAGDTAPNNAWIWLVIAGVCLITAGAILYFVFYRKKTA